MSTTANSVYFVRTHQLSESGKTLTAAVRFSLHLTNFNTLRQPVLKKRYYLYQGSIKFLYIYKDCAAVKIEPHNTGFDPISVTRCINGGFWIRHTTPTGNLTFSKYETNNIYVIGVRLIPENMYAVLITILQKYCSNTTMCPEILRYII